MPSFTSPFTWRIIAQMSNAYEIHDIDLLDQRYREPDERLRRAVADDAALSERLDADRSQQAATTHLGQVFLGFSRFPAARSAVDAHGVTTVRWTDMRFAGGPLGARSARPRGASPFTATVRIGATGRVIERVARRRR